MAKNKFKKFATSLLALSLSLACLTSCTTTPSNGAAFLDDEVTVTVNGGSGSGTYGEGDRCTVKAEVPEGQRFMEWQVYGVSVSTDETYTFNVDFDIELQAIYKDVEKMQYTVTVNGGSIGQNGSSVEKVNEGDTVKIYPAESQARKFVKWIVGEEESATYAYELTVTQNVEITAVFENYCMVSVSGGTVNGNRSQIVKEGEKVTVKANVDDSKYFRYWYTLDEDLKEVKVSEKESYTFQLNDSLKIYAKFANQVSVTVINGTAADSAETQISALQGETVKIVANAPEDETKKFIGWYVNDKLVFPNMEYDFKVDSDTEIEARYGELELTKVQTPDNSAGKLIYREDGGAIAFDRAGSTMFAAGVDYVLYYVYASADAEKDDYIAQFKLNRYDGSANADFNTSIETMDGVKYECVRGGKGVFWITPATEFYNMMSDIIDECTDGQTYYFAAQAIATEEMKNQGYTDSDISEIGETGIVYNASKVTEKYIVNVVNGTIDGTLTSVTAWKGWSVTVTAAEPVDDGNEYVFAGWQEVSYDAYGAEILGETVSKSKTYTFSASKNVTLKAVYGNKADLPALATLDNSTNKLIYNQANGAIALDRSGTTMFATGVDHILFYVYTSADAEKDAYIAQFKFNRYDGSASTSIVTSFESMNGVEYEIVQGGKKNFWVMSDRFSNMMRDIIGDSYSASNTYYFAVQAIAADDSGYANSEISAIGTVGIQF